MLRFIANWKMNMLCSEAEQFAYSFKDLLGPLSKDGAADVGIAPPFTAISATLEALWDVKGLCIGAQNVHWLQSGAQTGEVSALMLKELGCEFAIVGHSERRQFYGETCADVAKRAKAAVEAELFAVVCIGESKAERESGKTEQVVLSQLKDSLAGFNEETAKLLLVAYEPVWAIGTGLAATPEMAAEVHLLLRNELCKMFGNNAGSNVTLLYGGSTSPENIGSLMSDKNIDGALVGGASLKPQSFAALIDNGRKAKQI